MRKARLLSTVAATLLLAASAASAQDMKKGEAPAPAPAAQQTAPAEKIAPTLKPGEQKADTKKTPETIGRAPKASESGKSQTMEKRAPAGAAADVKAGSKGDVKSEATPKAKENEKASENAGAKEAAPGSAKPAGEQNRATTGEGAAAGSAKLSAEQHTKITTIIKQQKVAPAQLSISIRMGTRVPDNVHFYPLPQEVFVIYPEWRGYDYILVGDEILVIDHRTHEIVAILEA
jgi:hypothetical protein